MPGLRPNTLLSIASRSSVNARHLVLRTPARNRVSSRPPTFGTNLAARPQLMHYQCTVRDQSTHVTSAFDPLNPQVETDEFGLPLSPIPLPADILNPPPTRITSAQLQRLHKLAAIAPPPVGSQDEVEMLRGLEGLLGLMDQVKKVELDHELVRGTEESDDGQQRKEAIRRLLASGSYADPNDVFDGSRIDEELPMEDEIPGHEAVVGKDLLAWRSRPMER